MVPPAPAEQLVWYQRIWRAIKAIFCCCCHVPERDVGAPLRGRVSPLPAAPAPQGRGSPPPFRHFPLLDGGLERPRLVRVGPMVDPYADMPGLEAVPAAAAPGPTAAQINEFMDEILAAPPNGDQFEGLLDPPPAAAAAAPTVTSVHLLHPRVLNYNKDVRYSRPSGFIEKLEECPPTERSEPTRRTAFNQYRSIVTEVDYELVYRKQMFDPKEIGGIIICGPNEPRINRYFREEGQELACVAIHALRQFGNHLTQTPDNMASYLLAVASFRVAVWPLLNVLVADYKRNPLHHSFEQGQRDAADGLIIVPVQQYLMQHSASSTFLARENAKIAEELLEQVLMPLFINAQGKLQFLPEYTT